MKLDLGCGRNKQPGFFGVDILEFPEVDLALDLTETWLVDGSPNGHYKPWPWDNGSIEEIQSSHFVEHLVPRSRIHFVNECYRILQPGGKLTLITPHWNSGRAYGDLTHEWPPVSSFWYYYLNREWRLREAPHTDIKHNFHGGYNCDFDFETFNHSAASPLLDTMPRDIYFRLRDAIDDTKAVLTKRPSNSEGRT